MRHRAGSRLRLATAAGVSISTAQGWEKDGVVPEGRSLARLVSAYRDLGDELIDVIAAGDVAQEWGEREPPEPEP